MKCDCVFCREILKNGTATTKDILQILVSNISKTWARKRN